MDIQWSLLYEPNVQHAVAIGTVYVSEGSGMATTDDDAHHNMFITVPLEQYGQDGEQEGKRDGDADARSGGSGGGGSYSCAGGFDCNGNGVTGTPNQQVCGGDLHDWVCTSSGWKNTGATCSCG
jgi:hypothetical protein